MKKLIFTVATCWLMIVTPVRGLVVLDLETTDGATSINAKQGDKISLTTLMTTDNNVGILSYTIGLTVDDWILWDREYTDFGWTNVFPFDQSVPGDGTGSTVITNGLYAATPAVADFYFNTGRTDNGGVTGTDITIETFDLEIPLTASLTTYTLTLTPINASGPGATPSLTVDGPVTFDVIVKAVPEPGSLLLGGTALLAFSLTRRRGTPAKKSTAPAPDQRA